MWGKIKRFLSKFKPVPKVEIKPIPKVEVKPEVPPAPVPALLLNVNPEKFVAHVGLFFGKMKHSQIQGFRFIIQAWNESGLKDHRWLAYMLATTWHETAFTMQPIEEYGSTKYLMGKKYWPYIGRGYVQLTWKYNYEKYGIAKTPEKALNANFAAFIMIDGMTKGIFTGKKLSQYFNSKVDDPIGARRIINGTDRAGAIAAHHYKFLEVIKLSV